MNTKKQFTGLLMPLICLSLSMHASAQESDPEEVKLAPETAEKKASRALPVPSDPVQIYGWQEKVSLVGVDHVFVGKLDTGARTSSIHAIKQTEFQRNGETWVRFMTSDTNVSEPKLHQIEAPLIDHVAVKEPNGKPHRRRVVRMAFRIGKRTVRANFTLNNRSNMVCPMLIGRKTIAVLGWVDPTRKYLAGKELMR